MRKFKFILKAVVTPIIVLLIIAFCYAHSNPERSIRAALAYETHFSSYSTPFYFAKNNEVNVFLSQHILSQQKYKEYVKDGGVFYQVGISAHLGYSFFYVKKFGLFYFAKCIGGG